MGFFSNLAIRNLEDFGRALPDLATRPARELADELTPEQVRHVSAYRAASRPAAVPPAREPSPPAPGVPARIVAVMADGTLIPDAVADLGHLVDLVLGYRRDADCRYVNAYAADGRVLAVWRCGR